MQIGVACLVVFLAMALLMYKRSISALLALPIMAITIAVIGRIPPNDILKVVIDEGSTKLYGTYTTTMFGAVLAEMMNKHGIAKALIRWVAEFAGDNPFLLALVLTGVTAILFSTLGGLGAVIMVGTIILPVMLSLGISNITAGSLFLFGISLGGMFNITSWKLYMDVLKIPQADIIAFVVPFALIISLLIVTFIAVELRSLKNVKYVIGSVLAILGSFFLLYSNARPRTADSMQTADPTSILIAFLLVLGMSGYAIFRHRQDLRSDPVPLAMITPVVPLILVLGCNWKFIPAFVFGIAYCALITWKRDSVSLLTRSIIDGVNSVVPAVVLMIGIGMLINCVMHPAIASAMAPMIKLVVPTTVLPYVVVFTILAPLALYRGPLSLWGMGSGLVSLIQASTALSAQAIMGMLMSVGQIQGISDPTNTANIWIANYLGTDTQVLLRKTIPYAWTATLLGLILASALHFISG